MNSLKYRGGLTNSVSTAKKGYQKFWRLKTEMLLWENVKMQIFPTECENLSEIGAKSETEVNASLPLGGWTPLYGVVL